MVRGLASSHMINGSELLDIELSLEQGSKASIPVHEYTGTPSSSTRCSQAEHVGTIMLTQVNAGRERLKVLAPIKIPP